MLFLVVLFIVVPIARALGDHPDRRADRGLADPALLLADALLGSLLLRHQGRGAWQRFNKAIAERRFPGKEVADGLLIAIGGTLLLAPGFLTDIVGVVFLIPPTRAIVRRLLKGVVGKRFVVMGGPAGAAYGAASAGSRAYGYATRGDGRPTAPPAERREPRLRLRGHRRGDRGRRPAAARLAQVLVLLAAPGIQLVHVGHAFRRQHCPDDPDHRDEETEGE